MRCPACNKDKLDFDACPWCGHGRADPDPAQAAKEKRTKLITLNLTEQQYTRILERFEKVEGFKKEILARYC